MKNFYAIAAFNTTVNIEMLVRGARWLHLSGVVVDNNDCSPDDNGEPAWKKTWLSK